MRKFKEINSKLKLKKEAGATMIEYALCVFVVLFFVFIIIDLCRYLAVKAILQRSALNTLERVEKMTPLSYDTRMLSAADPTQPITAAVNVDLRNQRAAFLVSLREAVDLATALPASTLLYRSINIPSDIGLQGAMNLYTHLRANDNLDLSSFAFDNAAIILPGFSVRESRYSDNSPTGQLDTTIFHPTCANTISCPGLLLPGVNAWNRILGTHPVVVEIGAEMNLISLNMVGQGPISIRGRAAGYLNLTSGSLLNPPLPVSPIPNPVPPTNPPLPPPPATCSNPDPNVCTTNPCERGFTCTPNFTVPECKHCEPQKCSDIYADETTFCNEKNCGQGFRCEYFPTHNAPVSNCGSCVRKNCGEFWGSAQNYCNSASVNCYNNDPIYQTYLDRPFCLSDFKPNADIGSCGEACRLKTCDSIFTEAQFCTNVAHCNPNNQYCLYHGWYGAPDCASCEDGQRVRCSAHFPGPNDFKNLLNCAGNNAGSPFPLYDDDPTFNPNGYVYLRLNGTVDYSECGQCNKIHCRDSLPNAPVAWCNYANCEPATQDCIYDAWAFPADNPNNCARCQTRPVPTPTPPPTPNPTPPPCPWVSPRMPGYCQIFNYSSCRCTLRRPGG